jgi:hypothetical protein
MRATVILNLLIPSLGLLAQTNIDPKRRDPTSAVRPRRHAFGTISCSVLKPDARVSLVQRAVASPLVRFLLVILMIVKEASYLSLERRCLLQITDAAGAVEELPLELRGNSIPPHKHGRAQALPNLLLFLGEGTTVLDILSLLNRLYRDEPPSILRFRQASCRSARDRGIPSFRSVNAVRL